MKEISIAPFNWNLVTLGATAAGKSWLSRTRRSLIWSFIATESSIDKARQLSLYSWSLGIQPFARSFEIKGLLWRNCCSRLCQRRISNNIQESKVLVIASGIAKYGGRDARRRPTQGASAGAMLISQNPSSLNSMKIMWLRLVIWISGAQVLYDSLRQRCLLNPAVPRLPQTTWNEYQKTSWFSFGRLCSGLFPSPYPKLLKGLNKSMDKSLSQEGKRPLRENFDKSILYGQKGWESIQAPSSWGSCLLENSTKNLKAGDKTALFDYGSGAVAEIYRYQSGRRLWRTADD